MILASLGVVGGAIMGSLGIIGEYVGRIYEQVKGTTALSAQGDRVRHRQERETELESSGPSLPERGNAAA